MYQKTGPIEGTSKALRKHINEHSKSRPNAVGQNFLAQKSLRPTGLRPHALVIANSFAGLFGVLPGSQDSPLCDQAA